MEKESQHASCAFSLLVDIASVALGPRLNAHRKGRWSTVRTLLRGSVSAPFFAAPPMAASTTAFDACYFFFLGLRFREKFSVIAPPPAPVSTPCPAIVAVTLDSLLLSPHTDGVSRWMCERRKPREGWYLLRLLD